MPNILVSYRREDSDAITGRIRDRLAAHYGENSVFMDIDSIPFGLDFRKEVREALMRNDLVIAVIGPRWMGTRRGGSARIQDDADPVRIELETALKRGIPVVPVLVTKATMPKVAELPAGLKELPFFNAAEVSAGRDFNQHIDRLLRSIDQLLDARGQRPERRSEQAASARSEFPDLAEGAVSRAQKAGRPISEGDSRAHSQFRGWMQRRYLLFADRSLERRFMEVFRRDLYAVGQTAMLIGIAGWIVFGATDLLTDTGLESTRFRFMLVLPILILLYGLSFTKPARRLWQQFFAAFGLVGIICTYVGLLLVGAQNWFRPEQATMSFMFFLAAVGFAPFTTLYTLVIGFVIAALHFCYMVSRADVDNVHTLFYSLFVVASYAVAVMGAWVRERTARANFLRHNGRECDRRAPRAGISPFGPA